MIIRSTQDYIVVPASSKGFVFFLGPLECQEREVELGKRRKLFSVYDVHEEIGR